jgi:hypothetical protein
VLSNAILSFLELNIFQNGELVVICPHEKCITYEEICIMFIFLALFVNVECKKMLLIYIVDFWTIDFPTLNINLKLCDAK